MSFYNFVNNRFTIFLSPRKNLVGRSIQEKFAYFLATKIEIEISEIYPRGISKKTLVESLDKNSLELGQEIDIFCDLVFLFLHEKYLNNTPTCFLYDSRPRMKLLYILHQVQET